MSRIVLAGGRELDAGTAAGRALEGCGTVAVVTLAAAYLRPDALLARIGAWADALSLEHAVVGAVRRSDSLDPAVAEPIAHCDAVLVLDGSPAHFVSSVKGHPPAAGHYGGPRAWRRCGLVGCGRRSGMHFDGGRPRGRAHGPDWASTAGSWWPPAGRNGRGPDAGGCDRWSPTRRCSWRWSRARRCSRRPDRRRWPHRPALRTGPCSAARSKPARAGARVTVPAQPGAED